MGTFTNLPELFTLYLSYNRITSIPPDTFTNLPKLDYLELKETQIASIQPGAISNLPQLCDLILPQNQITSIQTGTFSNLQNLNNLDLEENQIISIQPGAFINLHKLKNLNLSSNKMTSIQPGTFTDLPELYDLDLSYNKITSIQPYTFTNLKLEVLSLYGNQITSIKPDAFANLLKLEWLDLCENQISVLPPSGYDMLSAIRDVEIYSNPWQCDCEMVPFRLKMTGSAYFENQITCAQPDNFRGQKIKDINPENLICNDTHASSTLSISSSFGTPESNTSPIAHPVGSTADGIHTSFTSSAAPTSSLFGTPESKTSPIAHHVGSRADDIHVSYAFIASTVSTFSSFGSPERHPVGSTSAQQPITTASLTTPLAIPQPVLIGSICGTVGGIVLVGAIVLTIWCKRRTRHPSPGQNSKVIVTVTNTTATGKADQALQSLKVVTHNNIPAALKQNPMYGCAGATPSTSCHDQTGQGQSQATTESYTSNTLAVTVSGQGQTVYQALRDTKPSNYTGPNAELCKATGVYQPITESHTNTTAAVVTSGYDQTKHGQSQDITESHTNTTTSVLTSGHDQTGQAQYQNIAKSHTNTTATATISGHDQTGQTESQNKTQSPDVRNLTYNQTVSLSQQNRLYIGAGSPPNNPTSEAAGKPYEIKTSGSPNQSKPSKDEPTPLPPPREGADTLLAVLEPYVYENVDSPLKSPKPKGTGGWPSAKNETQGLADKTKPTKEEPPSLLSSRRVDDAQLAVSQPHLYEDVDAPPKSPKPTGTGLRKFAKNKTIVTENKNKIVKDEPPPSLSPSCKGDVTMPSVSQPHLYEDVDAPPKSPIQKGTGLRNFAKNKAIVTENKNITVRKEPPPLPPPRKGDVTMPSVSQPHLYEDVDATPKKPKPTGTCLRQTAKKEALGTGIKSNPTKEDPPPLPPPLKGTGVLPVSQPHAHVDTPQKRPKRKGAALKQFAMSLGTVVKNKPPKDKLAPVPPQGKCTEARFEKSAGANDNLHVYENNELE
uniref:LRRCT domain-containing protein n=1 Tax=Branchiostoma floridae TaxID=7739 RepID=C3ZR15_BRAFL|eukprot:XP_002589045.1 hypothetical protein BRAFLDRAFT_87518 [Branchiostoma floridae]